MVDQGVIQALLICLIAMTSCCDVNSQCVHMELLNASLSLLHSLNRNRWQRKVVKVWRIQWLWWFSSQMPPVIIVQISNTSNFRNIHLLLLLHKQPQSYMLIAQQSISLQMYSSRVGIWAWFSLTDWHMSDHLEQKVHGLIICKHTQDSLQGV